MELHMQLSVVALLRLAWYIGVLLPAVSLVYERNVTKTAHVQALLEKGDKGSSCLL